MYFFCLYSFSDQICDPETMHEIEPMTQPIQTRVSSTGNL